MLSLICVASSGRGITREMEIDLIRAAVKLVKSGDKKHKIKSKHLEGFISSKHEIKTFGSLFGLECFAEFENNMGKRNIRYLVPLHSLLVDFDILDLSELISVPVGGAAEKAANAASNEEYEIQ